MTAVIILAAGSSSRMGHSKQLIEIGGETLLTTACKVALESAMDRTLVVLGSEDARHLASIQHLGVQHVVNHNWQKGMGSSLKAGLQHLVHQAPNLSTAIVMVCDQPKLKASHIIKLKEVNLATGKKIVASRYAGSVGVPALFHQSLFQEIQNLPDDQGAKKIIITHPADIAEVDFPEGVIDLDTPGDVEAFQRS